MYRGILKMKEFKDYLAESKKYWNFKVKIAGELPENFETKFKNVLEKYNGKIDSKSKTPIQKTPLDFPKLENREVHMFLVTTEYPVTPPEIENDIKMKTSVHGSCVKVYYAEECIDYEQIKPEKYETLLNSELKDSVDSRDAQKMVGEKNKFEFLSAVYKNKIEPTQYKGVNDKILAKNTPREKSNVTDSTEDKSFSLFSYLKQTSKGVKK
jgi:hypothetical protein